MRSVALIGILWATSVWDVGWTDTNRLELDLGDPATASQWLFLDSNGRIEGDELVLDGRQAMCKAFFLPLTWKDATLEAKFLVEPADKGVLACGFMVRAVDGARSYYVHFDRGQAILCRSDEDRSWIEIKRVSGLRKPAGQWHTGVLECRGDTLRVGLNGEQLYEARDDTLDGGRIGFYANQGKARIKEIAVTGENKRAETEFVVPPSLFTHVCIDAGAGGYEAFPDVCRLRDGRLMSVFYAGYGHVSLPNEELPQGGRICFCLSSDEGRTWSDAEILYDGPDDDRDPSISQLSSGRLLCNFFSLRKTEGGERAYEGLGSWVVSSDDGDAPGRRPAKSLRTTTAVPLQGSFRRDVSSWGFTRKETIGPGERSPCPMTTGRRGARRSTSTTAGCDWTRKRISSS